MRHAIMIMAHKNTAFVTKIAKYFSDSCDVFVHFDTKSHLVNEELNQLKNLPQVKAVLQQYDVNWGGTSVLECELWLLQYAIEHGEADYFHLISGQDYPIRPLDDFLKYFEEHSGQNYIQYTRLPNRRWENNTFSRLQYFYPYDWATSHDNPRRWVREQVRLQKERGIKRQLPMEFDHLYGGSQWFSITREAADTLLRYTREQPSLLRRMWMTFAPEEFYVATVLVNLIGEGSITQGNLRYIRWKNENGNRPANLGMEHFKYLCQNNCFFARKFERNISEDLLQNIDKYLLQDNKISQSPTGGWIYDGVLQYGYDYSFSNFIIQFCQELGIVSAVDAGCGDGLYVALWRELNLPFTGFDSNPYTERLADLMLERGSQFYNVMDITGDSINGSFELVVCKDMLPFIPRELINNAVHNLCSMSSHFIILSWNVQEKFSKMRHNEFFIKDIERLFAPSFIVENYMTAKLRALLIRKDCCVLIKKGTQILESL
jgi:hypothetical protein